MQEIFISFIIVVWLAVTRMLTAILCCYFSACFQLQDKRKSSVNLGLSVKHGEQINLQIILADLQESAIFLQICLADNFPPTIRQDLRKESD